MRTAFGKAFLFFLIAVWFRPSLAVDPSFLTGSAQTDGSISTSADAATAFQSTAESLVTLASLGMTEGDVVTNALSFVANFPSGDATELLSRRIIVDSRYGRDTTADVAALLALQNDDGGFGPSSGYQSAALDTAFALDALVAAGKAASDESQRAFGHLIGQQRSSGGWPLGPYADELYVTARALKALWHFRHTYAISNNLELAKNFLLARRGADGLWSSTDLSALALEAILPLLSDLTPVADSLFALQSGQLSNMSWGHDVHATALALRVIASSEIETNPTDPGSIIPNPDLGTITGRVITDGGIGLSGITVALSGTASGTAITQTDGSFFFNKLSAGSYLVELSAEGYGSFASPVVVGNGTNVDLGSINLNSPVVPTTATVRGVVTRASDGVVLSGVTVTANTKTATTNTKGEYEITDLEPGTVRLTAARWGYLSVSAVADVAVGGVVVFSPQMSTTNTGAITGTVRDATTNLPMSGVKIALSGATTRSVYTGSAGTFSITGFNAGPTTITASATGYVSVAVDIVAEIGRNYDFSPLMTPVGQATTTLQGVVTDASTKMPIGGAGIELTGANNAMAQADPSGRFRFEGLLPGTTTITAQNGGYLARSVVVEIADGQNLMLPMELLPEGFATPSSTTTGRVVEAGSGNGIPGVVVEAFQGETAITTVADAEGRFELEKVTEGLWKVELHRSNFIAFDTEFLMPSGLPIIALGSLEMSPVARLPDLVPFSLDRTGLVSDPDTFVTTGTLGITLRNQGQAATESGFDVFVYFDADGDEQYNPAVDRSVVTTRVSEIVQPDTNLRVDVSVDIELPYRDAPLTVRLDNLGEIPEVIDENNQANTADLAGCGA